MQSSLHGIYGHSPFMLGIHGNTTQSSLGIPLGNPLGQQFPPMAAGNTLSLAERLAGG